MTKRERERIEREKLNQVLKDNPKIKEIIDNLIDNPDPDLQAIIQPIIEKQLEKARIQGTQIGWISHSLRCYDKIKDMTDIEEAKKLFKQEADEMQKKMNLQAKEV